LRGTSLRSIARLSGVHRTTTANLMLAAGERCRTFLASRMRGLNLSHLQCDEIWTFVRKKQGRLTQEESSDTSIGDQYLFVALDEATKLIPCFTLGKRTRENTERFMRDLAGCL